MHKNQHDRRTPKRRAKALRRLKIIARRVNMRRNNVADPRPLTWADLNQDAMLARGEAMDMLSGMDKLRNALAAWRNDA